MELPVNLAAPMDVSAFQGGVHPASQDLFEAMALQARDRHASGLGEVGHVLAQRLDSYLERSRQFSARVEHIANSDTAYLETPSPARAGAGPDDRVMTVLQSLHRMFDYSIETQVVVRSATQMSGAVNTLLRGQ